MISKVFPRLFGTFREGAIVHQKFIFTTAGASPVILHRNERGNSVQPTVAQPGQVTLARTGVGLYTLTVAGGARQLTLANARVLNKTATVGNNRRIEVNTQTESTGALALQIVDNAGAAADLVTANDELHVIIYVDK